MTNQVNTPEEYVAQLSEERRVAVEKLRQVIKKNLPKGFEEGIQYKMLSYHVPHSIYPKGYHCNPKVPLPFLNLASQKNSINLYHMGLYTDPKLLEWFVTNYPKHCKYKLDMGKSCVRFKKIDDIPYQLIGELIAKMGVQDWINHYETSLKK